ncbi:MAG: hypothetical protein AVDCRST_MAG56-6867, partial [uncultured Cytophagales bacterium]
WAAVHQLRGLAHRVFSPPLPARWWSGRSTRCATTPGGRPN